MITYSGAEIPDPPSDPEQRRIWKQVFYMELYGASPAMIRKAIESGIEQQESRSYRFEPEPLRPRLVRTIVIGVLAFIGGTLVIQGAVHNLWRVSLLGIVLVSFVFGYIITVAPLPIRTLRTKARAFWRAMFLMRLFRRWL